MLEAAYILRDWTGVRLGHVQRRKPETVFGFAPRPLDEELLSTAGSFVRTGLVPAP
jgi:hypothetical protein